MMIRDENGALTRDWVRNPCYIFDIIPVANSTVRTDEWDTRTDYTVHDLDLTEVVRFMDNGFCRFVMGGGYGVTDETLARLDEIYDREYEEYKTHSKDVKVWRYVRRDPLKHEYFDGKMFDHAKLVREAEERNLSEEERGFRRVQRAVVKAKEERIEKALAKESLTENQAKDLGYEILTLERMKEDQWT